MPFETVSKDEWKVFRSCARYRINVHVARFAHALVRMAKRIMPAGHESGVFVERNAGIESDLACYGINLSRVDAENRRLKAKLVLLNELMEGFRAEKSYSVSDRMREVIHGSVATQDVPSLVSKYKEAFRDI
jgi:hypothetical protein